MLVAAGSVVGGIGIAVFWPGRTLHLPELPLPRPIVVVWNERKLKLTEIEYRRDYRLPDLLVADLDRALVAREFRRKPGTNYWRRGDESVSAWGPRRPIPGERPETTFGMLTYRRPSTFGERLRIFFHEGNYRIE